MAACAPAPEAPFRAEVVRFDPAGGRYRPEVVEIATVTDLAAMEGTAARLVSGARFRLDPQAFQGARSLAEFRAQVLKAPGGPPSFAGYERGGVVRGEDFHSVNLLTTYWNFEVAQRWFAGHGAGPADLRKLDVYYFPEFVEVENGRERVQTDNALFYGAFEAFLVLPFDTFQRIPLSMNQGVVAHEYAHAVFNARVYAGEPVPWPFERLAEDAGAWTQQLNVLKSLDEGLADFFGAQVVGDPDFIARSIIDAAEARDPRPLRCATAGMRQALLEQLGDYDPYPLGTVLGHVLWTLGRGDEVGRAAVEALPDFAGDLLLGAPAVDERQLLARVIARLPEDLRAEACGLAADRLARSTSEIVGCSTASPPEETCP